MNHAAGQTLGSKPTPPAARSWDWPTPWIAPPSTEVTVSTIVEAGDDRGDHVLQSADGVGSRERPNHAPTTARGPSTLTRMHVERAVSPWLNHFSREDVLTGGLSRMVTAGVRGVGASQTELNRAIGVSTSYDEQLSWLLATGCTAQQAYWELAAADTQAACAVLQPVYEVSQGTDGFVSLQVAPANAHGTYATMTRICQLYRRIDRANFLVAIPATAPGAQALQATVSAGCNSNATAIFSLARYASVIDAYQSGLETFIARGGDPTTVHGVASLSLGPVDAEVNRRIDLLGDRAAVELRGLAALAQSILAYRLFEERFSSQRWARLAKRGATPQRLAWSSMETDPGTGCTMPYLDVLNLPNTAQLLSASRLATLNRTGLGISAPMFEAREAAGVVSALAALRIDLNDVAAELEKQDSQLVQQSLADALDRLSTRPEHR